MSREWSQYESFYNFHYMIMATLCQKISLTKFQKSKIWDDCYKGISAGFILVYSISSVDTVFMENLGKLLWKILKQPLFCNQFTPPPLPPREPSRFFSLSPSSSLIQEDRFEPTNFNRGPRISFISILTFHEKVNHLKQLVIRFVQKLTV